MKLAWTLHNDDIERGAKAIHKEAVKIGLTGTAWARLAPAQKRNFIEFAKACFATLSIKTEEVE